MAVIKKQHAGAAIRNAIVLDLAEVRDEARAIRRDAQDQADAIVKAAQAEAKSNATEMAAAARKEGHEAGYSEGRAEGEREAHAAALAEHRESFTSLQSQWQVALDAWDAERACMIREARTEVLQLALLLTEKITKRAIEVSPDLISDQLAAAIAVVLNPAQLQVAVHPDDRPMIESALPGLLASVSTCQSIDVVEDDTLMRGGCIVRTQGGSIDASIETQLAQIALALLPGQMMPDSEETAEVADK
ncbi:MAG: FliH/SctL family protein [Phycisphaerales bacterium]